MINMVVVKKMPGESDEAVIRRFSRQVVGEGIVQEIRRRQFHLKPSAKKKAEAEEARRMKKFSHGQ